MKILSLNLIFELPSSFNGTLREAFDLYLAYRDSEEPIPDAHPGSVSIRVNSEPFIQNQRYGFKVASEGGVYALRQRAWVRLDKNPSVCYSHRDTWIK